MSIQLNTNYKQDGEADIHLMPCKIDYDGEANVQTYFKKIISKSINKGLNIITEFKI